MAEDADGAGEAEHGGGERDDEEYAEEEAVSYFRAACPFPSSGKDAGAWRIRRMFEARTTYQ